MEVTAPPAGFRPTAAKGEKRRGRGDGVESREMIELGKPGGKTELGGGEERQRGRGGMDGGLMKDGGPGGGGRTMRKV